MLYLHFPLCHSERSEESSRQAQFAPLDCHVATVVAPRNDIMVGHPHPIVRSREIPTVTVFPRNDKEEWNIPLANRGVKLRFCAMIKVCLAGHKKIKEQCIKNVKLQFKISRY